MRILALHSILLALLLAAAPGNAPAPSRYDQAFWKTWADGQAELTSYQLTEPHYRAPRQGVAVTIFVTETFSSSLRVKSDPGKHPKNDEFSVMKLNLVKDFQTGVYDYNDMTSAFLALDAVNGRAAGSMTKIAFSSQEWCGTVYQQLLFDAAQIRNTRHSYFDGEADQQSLLPYPPNGISEETLYFWVRGMAEPEVKPGATITVPFLPALQSVRDQHKPAAWAEARLSRSAAASSITVPAGKFNVETWTAKSGDWSRTFYVDTAAPHRIVKWETSAGEKAEMLASERMKYWMLNGPGGEENLKKLKLSPRPPRTT